MATQIEQGGVVSSLSLLVVTCDDDYPEGGYELAPGPNGVVLPTGQSSAGDYLAVWDADGGKLKCIDPTTNKEAAGGTDLSGVVFRVLTG